MLRFLALAVAFTPLVAVAQTPAAVDLSVAQPAYSGVAPPVVNIDAGHNNYHTADGRYAPFATVLRNDGYRVASLSRDFSEEALKETDVLVVSNALSRETVWPWRLPARPAFTPEEVKAVHDWVERGGALLLIVDHMPFPGDMGPLIGAFGFRFDNGFALTRDDAAPEIFTRARGQISDHEITKGIDQARSFGGSSFKAPAQAKPLLRLDGGWTIKLPVEAMQFPPGTPERPATADDLRGAAMDLGKGRIVVFSEAAMFTSQGPAGQAEGIGSPGAEQNKQLLLNTMHWLSRLKR